MRKTADVYPVDEQRTVAVIVDAPSPPPLRRWKDEAYQLFYSKAIREFTPPGEWNQLFKLVDSWSFSPPHLTRLTILPTNHSSVTHRSQGPATRVKRGLLDIVGQISETLFGTATEEEVVALQSGLTEVARQEVTVFHNQLRLLSVINTTRRYLWQNRHNINLLINSSRHLNHALRNLSSFTNILARRIHTMWIARHLRMMVERVDKELQNSRDEFTRFRNTALDVQRGQLSTALLSESELTGVLMRLRSASMPIEWYYANTPVRMVSVGDTRIIFTIDLWSRAKDSYEEWTLHSYPIRDHGFRKKAIVRERVITDIKRQFVLQPSMCRGLDHKLCIISNFEKHACELGIISGSLDPCRLELTAQDVPFALYPYRPNEWVVVPNSGESQVTLRCDNQRHEHLVVTQTELWWVHPRCNLDTFNLTTHGIRSYHLDVVIKYEPPTIVNVSFSVPPLLMAEVPKLLSFHPQLEVEGIPGNLLEDPGNPIFFNPYHLSYGMVALAVGLGLALIIGLVCLRKRCAKCQPSRNTDPPSRLDKRGQARSPNRDAQWSALDDNVTFSFT